MKKLLYFVPLTALLLFLFAFNVNAKTYDDPREISQGTLLEAGDIIKLGTGSYDVAPFIFHYETVALNKDGILYDGQVAREAQDLVVPWNCYFSSYSYTNSQELGIESSTNTCLLTVYSGKCVLTCDNKTLSSLNLHGGEQKRIYANIDGIAPPFKYLWEGIEEGKEDAPQNVVTIYGNASDLNYITIPYGKWKKIYCSAVNQNKKYISLCASVIINNLDESHDDESNEVDASEDEIATPSELPYGTVKCGNGGKGNGGKDAVDIKVLKPESRDTSNQYLFAKNYFKNRPFSTVFSYNVYPPYGVNNGFKNSTRIIYWADTGIKQGDEVYAVWYCQSSKKPAQMIKCDIDANGIVSIRIPQIGNMSTITLIKVK